MANQNPEQAARDAIDGQLREAGWVIQGRRGLDPQAGRGVAVREYPTDAGPMDYLLLVDGQWRMGRKKVLPYGPYVNPADMVWTHVKREVGKHPPGSTREMLGLACSIRFTAFLVRFNLFSMIPSASKSFLARHGNDLRQVNGNF